MRPMIQFNSLYCRGTLGIVNMTVGDGCNLYLGSTGNTQGISTVSPRGVFDFETLTVKAGGEVTVTYDLTGASSIMEITVSVYNF